MNIILISEKTYEEIQKSFISSLEQIESICGKSNDLSVWLDNQDVCQLLNISKRTLQYYRDTGVIPYSKIGNKIYYKKADIEFLINSSYILNIKRHGY